MKPIEHTIWIVLVTIACACGLSLGLKDRCRELDKKLDRIEQAIEKKNQATP